MKIAGHNYKLKYKKDVFDSDGNSAFGTCDIEDATIELQRGIKPTQEQEYLLHEAAEAANFHYNIGLKHRQIDCISATFAAFIRDNKKLIRRVFDL